MSSRKKPNWILIIVAVMLALIFFNALFSLGMGIIGLVFTLIGGILKLVFSKAGMVVIGVALVFYILHNRGRGHSYY